MGPGIDLPGQGLARLFLNRALDSENFFGERRNSQNISDFSHKYEWDYRQLTAPKFFFPPSTKTFKKVEIFSG